MLVFIGGPIAILMLGLLILAVAVWRSGDLEPVKAQAWADGLQTDWSDPMWTADADHVVAVTELEALASGIVFHAGSYGFYNETASRDFLLVQPGSEIAADLRNHYGTEPPPWLTEFVAWRQRYVARPLRLVHPTELRRWNTMKSLRTVQDWLCYRILVREAAPIEDIWALFDAIDLFAFDIDWHAKRRWEMLVRAASLICLRQDAWGDNLGVLIEALQIRRQQMGAEYRRMLQGQFIAACELIERDPHHAAKDLGLAIPRLFEIHVIAVAIHRLGRVSVLDRQRQLTVDLLASPNFMSSLLQTPTGCWCGSGKVRITHPAGLLDAVFNYERNAWITWILYHKYSLILDLAIADLSGQPWPHDSMDPAGSPLTPWYESGVVVGAISVGPDGLAGTPDDWRLRLRDPPLLAPAAIVAPSSPAGAPTAHPTP